MIKYAFGKFLVRYWKKKKERQHISLNEKDFFNKKKKEHVYIRSFCSQV